MNLKNEQLQKIADTYKKKSNKELSNVLMNLHRDFTNLKDVMIAHTETINEIGSVYDKVYAELQSRLHFEDKKPEQNGDGN